MYQPECMSKKDAIELHQFALDLLDVSQPGALRTAIDRLHGLLVFDSAFCAYGDPRTIDGCETPNARILQFDFPEAYLTRYMQKHYYRIDGVAQQLFSTWAPQNWDTVIRRYQDGKLTNVDREAREYGLMDGWSHGVRHPAQGTGSVFSFAGAVVENDLRTQTILQMLVPHLGQALKRLYHGPIQRRRNIERLGLTRREMEVLKWLRQGKSSWEISMILQRSERVVNFHVRNLVGKLGAVNRLQAMAIAMEKGLV
jgi:DNA-binding CsgD family transcriptional regulator